MHFIKFLFIMIFTSFVIETTTVQTDSVEHRYLSSVATDDQILSNNKRFQQIMQGVAPADSVWLELQKTTKKINVKSEIDKLNISYIYQSSWPNSSIQLGSVTAIDFDKDGHVVLFHRANHVWKADTFDLKNVYSDQKKGPIQYNTILALDRNLGQLVYEWGKELFYMPHGLTIDHEDNVWLTDVALHQVFKFGPRGSTGKPLMVLGTAFVPGVGPNKFCKPTSVAVLKNGDFFVADGYCNARILKYSKDGQIILFWGHNSFSGLSYEVAPHNYFAIPHDLTLVPEKNLICVADRENGRVQCFSWSDGTFHSQYHSPLVGDRLFGVDYTPYLGGQLIVVNGPTGLKSEHYNEVRGYVWDMASKKVLSKFGPNDLQFSNPHDVAVTADGMEIYVAELNPPRLHRFLHKSLVKSISMSAIKTPLIPDAMAYGSNLPDTTAQKTKLNSTNNETSDTYHGPSVTAIAVVCLMLSFACITFSLALLIAHRRKRGCVLFESDKRCHAWNAPSTNTENFTLGNLLMDHTMKRNGFKKLDQAASDEETEATIIQPKTRMSAIKTKYLLDIDNAQCA